MYRRMGDGHAPDRHRQTQTDRQAFGQADNTGRGVISLCRAEGDAGAGVLRVDTAQMPPRYHADTAQIGRVASLLGHPSGYLQTCQPQVAGPSRVIPHLAGRAPARSVWRM